MGIEAVALAQLAQAASVAGAVVSTVSGMQQASYQAAVAARNAEIADENALKAVEDAQREQLDYGEEARRELGALIAEQSASGLSLTTGSSLLRRRDLESRSRRDAERIRTDGNLRAQGFQQQASDFRSEASNAKSARRAAMFGGAINIGSSYLGGATAVKKAKAAKVTRT